MRFFAVGRVRESMASARAVPTPMVGPVAVAGSWLATGSAADGTPVVGAPDEPVVDEPDEPDEPVGAGVAGSVGGAVGPSVGSAVGLVVGGAVPLARTEYQPTLP